VSIFIGLDIGTSGVRAVAFSTQGQMFAEGRATIEFTSSSHGNAQQNPDDWWKASAAALKQVAKQLGSEIHQVKGIGLTGQCPSFTLLYEDGKTLDNGIIYQDNRATKEAEQLMNIFGKDAIHRRTGQNPSSFYILPKLLWLKEHHPQYLVPGATVVQPMDLVGWHLTGNIITDPTHAACTLAYDLVHGTWTEDWLEVLGLHHLKWPGIIKPCSKIGQLSDEVAEMIGFPAGTPIVVGGADSLCAVYGSNATDEGILCDVSGSSTCLHLTVTEPIKNLAVNTYPHIENELWCAEVGINTTGIAITWLKKLLNISYESLIEAACNIKPGSDGLLFLPHLSGGERDMPERPGAFIGLRLDHSAGHLARAVFEGIAFALKQRIDLLIDSGSAISRVVSSGGGTKNALFNQIKADIFGLPLDAVTLRDTTALGAALSAAKAVGIEMMTTDALNYVRYLPDEATTHIYQDHYHKFCSLEEIFIKEKDTYDTSKSR
jgi:xylulokinase